MRFHTMYIRRFASAEGPGMSPYVRTYVLTDDAHITVAVSTTVPKFSFRLIEDDVR